jgi:hypothetical protein
MNTEKEKADAIYAREVAEKLGKPCEPLCPQFRVHHTERFYPVQGSCVLAGWPGWFMIPSIAEYREYCTTPQFSQCCWFSGAAGTSGLGESCRGGHATPAEAWAPPEARGKMAA